MRWTLSCLFVVLGVLPLRNLLAEDQYLPTIARRLGHDDDRLEELQRRLSQLQAEVGELTRDHEPRPADSVQQTVKVAGFFQADAGWFHQDAANMAAVDDIQDGAAFRRARLLATGDVWDNVGNKLEMDFGFPGRPTFMDVWLEISDLSMLNNLRVGQFRHPIGMDGLTSVTQLTFLERALPFAFLPIRQIGSMPPAAAAAGSMTWAVSAFRFPTGPFGGNVGDNGGHAMATRVTLLPIDHGNDNSLDDILRL